MSDTPTPSQAAEKAVRKTLPVVAICHREPQLGNADRMIAYLTQTVPEKALLVLLSDAESQLAELRAEVERLKAKARESDARLFEVRKLLNERPAMNASLAPAYVHWSGKVYALDWLNALDDAALAADGKDGAR